MMEKVNGYIDIHLTQKIPYRFSNMVEDEFVYIYLATSTCEAKNAYEGSVLLTCHPPCVSRDLDRLR